MVRTIIVVVCAMLHSGCATVFLGKDKGVVITSNVENARVYNSNNKQIGVTPYTFRPAHKGKTYQLSIEKDSFTSVPLVIKYRQNMMFAAIDGLFFCIPCIIDFPTGNIYRADTDSMDVFLKRIINASVQKVDLYVDPVSWNIKEGTQIGEELKEPFYFRKSDFESYIYKETIGRASNESYYKINNAEQESDFKYVQRSDLIHIQPVVSDLKSNLVRKRGKNIRRCEATITWRFTQNNGKKLIAEVSDKYVREGNNEESKYMLNVLVEMSAIKVLTERGLYDTLMQSKTTQSIQGVVSSFDSLVIPAYNVPAFSKNKDMMRHLMKSVITIEHKDGHGSGFLITEDGYIITNYHVVKDKKVVNVRINESITLSAEVIRGDDDYDVALLKITGQGFAPLQVIHSDSVAAGEDIFAIGTPEDIALGQSVTKGIISGKRMFSGRVYLQTDVAINSGNSGGPLLNEEGKVVGMVTSKLVGNGIEGIGFCVPSNTIFEVLNIKYR